MKKLLLFGFLLIIAAAGFAQAPDISYPSPQVFVLGKAITNLAPTNSGGAVPNTAYSEVTTLAGNGTAGFVDNTGLAARFDSPYAIASDASGNIYVADYGNNAIRKITPAGVVTTVPTSGLSSPAGIAVDAAGNIYIADTGNQLIKMVTPAGVVTIIAGNGSPGAVNGPALTASFSNPQDVAVDLLGNIYVADFNNNQIRKISAGVVSVLAGSGSSGLANGAPATARFKNPFGVAVDAAGNVYVADFNNSAIRKVTPGGVVSTLAGNGTAGFANANGTAARFSNPGDIAVDANGNVYVTDSYNSLVRKITPAGNVTTFAGNNGNFDRVDGIGTNAVFGFPLGITIDPAGNLYTSDNGTHAIRKAITKGYYIDKILPAGLVFDPTTGIISGTPTAVTAAANYTISAYNDAGSSSKTISIAVRLPSTDATLSGLTASVGGINPAFVATGKRYVINVANSESGTTVTPVLINPQASLTVNGVSLASGAASNTIPLNLGNNDITIKVTAEDGLTVGNYLVSVVRAKVAIAGPVISYNTTNNFPVNVTIPNLAPTNTGGAVPAISYGQVTTFATGFSAPWGITTDVAGNVYVADGTKQIRKITPAGAVSVFVTAAANLKNVTGLGSDAQGNIYAAESGNNKIRIISPTGTLGTVAGYAGNYGNLNGADADAEFATPAGVAVDGLSNLYIADQDNKLIRKRTLDGQVTTLAGTGATGSVNGPGSSATFTVPIGIASDFDGNVFVADLLGQVIRKITPAGQVSTFAGRGTAGEIDGTGTAAAFDSPAAVAVDPIGTIYVADAANSKIRRITPSGEVTIFAGDGQYRLLNGNGMLSSFSYPLGVAADQNGHLFVADYGNNAVRKIETLGYGIYPHDFLPAGLVFDNKTGIISGKPTTVTPSRSYKITAYNLGGSSVSNITIRIINITNEARLSNITLNPGTLSPAFASATTTYSASVTKTSIIITPTAMEPAANIKINGVAVVSGAASAPVPLVLGANAISIVVTATDGVTQKTYTLNVTRAPAPPNADLSGLTVSAGTLSPAFTSGTVNYTTAVSNATASFIITPTSPNSLATIQVNGAAVASGAASTAIPLTVGLNTITTIVTDENGNNKTYTIQVTRAASVNADLASLGLSDGTLTPVFNAATLTYTAAVANTVTGIAITPATADATATIKVNGVTVANGVTSATIPLNVGANVITTVVTAQDGVTLKTYTLNVNRAASTNADLSALALSQGTLSPAFGAGILVYSASVTNSVTSITVTPTTSDVSATIQVNGVAVSSGSASAAILLNAGLNVVTTVVTAGDGATTKTYTTNITRVASNNSNLAGLSLSAGTLSPAFDPATISYTSLVGVATTSITITPTQADAGASIKVNGVTVVSGTPSANIPLNMGANVITTVVTAEDGTTKTYTTTVTRASSTNADLSALSISAGTLSPAFASGTTVYTAAVNNTTTGITLTPTSADANSVIKVNNTVVATGTSSLLVPLVVGNNNITVQLTAEDGVTINTYTITVTRAPSAVSSLAALATSAGPISPVFDPATLTYAVSVANGVASATITPTTTDANATVKVNGVTVASGSASTSIPLNIGLNAVVTTVTAEDGITVTSYTANITRAPSANADLASLTLSSAIINPAFASGTLSYTAAVSNATTSTTLTPTVSDATASITVNGVAVTSGSASVPINLSVGLNTITTVVTAQDGVTTKTYTVDITRAASSDADLSGLTLSAGTLSPAFTAANANYTVTVTSLNSITVTPVQNDVNASITVNGTAVTSGTASQPIPLTVGGNPINILVTAADGTTKNYLVTVNRAASGDAFLTNLVPGTGTLSPVFASGTVAYTVPVGNAVTTINFTPTLSDANATVQVNGIAVVNSTASQNIPLAVGANAVTVTVTAENGTPKNYTVSVVRAGSADATLSNLTVNGATIAPVFASGTITYTASVSNTITSVTLTPVVNEPNATVTVNGSAVASGSASGTIPLVVGANTITTVITAQDGSTTKTYTVTVNRALSSNADLANLTASSGTLSPTFASAVVDYTVHVGNTTTGISVTPTRSDAGAVIRVNGTIVSSGSASGTVPLVVGDNAITVQVTAADATVKTYTVTVNRAMPAASTDANLASLAVSTGTLTPAFAQATPAYTVSVPNTTTGISVTPTSTESHATITVNGTTVASGTASGAINLNGGANIITTIITAEDGTTIKTYTITVNRALSTNANLANITLSAGTLNPVFVAGTINYTAAVSNAINTIQLTPTTEVASATIKVNGVTVASGAASAAIPLNIGPNAITTIVTAETGVTKTYTVTVTRAASPNADLANLTLNTGTLNPVFAAGTTTYTAAAGNAVNTIRLTPTVAEVNATVKVNGVTVASGSASAALPLVVGPNVITTVVTAQDGTPKTYTVTVTRAQSPNANLANLTLSTATLNPVFAAGTISYTAAVSNAITTIKVTPTVADAMATVQVDGLTVASGTASTDINLAVGSNVITTLVTAEDGTTKTYIVTVDRAKSPNANLANLSLSAGTLNPVFAAGTVGYTASVSNATAGIAVTATVSEPNATLQINGAAVASGSPSASIPLLVGPNVITTLVTAQDGTTKTYTITVTRAPSPDATLSNIVLSDGTLSPGFAAATTSYTASVANAITSVTLTPTVNEPNATVKVNGVTVASGAASGPIALVVGPNVITTTVTAQDGVSTQVYTTTITRAPSSNAFLTALGVSTGNYSPGFGTNIFDYTMLVTNNVTSLSLTPVLADNTATITVNGVASASGAASAPVVLAVGNNFIKTVVTAQDGVTVKTYTVIVNRALSSENDLSDLAISAGTLTPAFQSGINDYTASVSNATTSLTVKPTVADATATVKVNNVAVASGTSSAPISLVVGTNTISAIVTAQNGVTNTYTIVVTRAASANADLSNLTANTGALSPAFASNTVSYTGATVNNTISTIKLTPTTSDATATITVNGITVTSGTASPDIPLNVGPNAIPVTVKAQAGNTKTYTVTISRAPSSNADLAGITVSGGSLSPAFVPGTINYTTTIGNANTGITVTPNTSDVTSTVTVNGATVTPGTASGTLPLTVGSNTITVVVKAQDGTVKTYTIVATREASSNADLTNLAPDAGTLSPVFAPGTQAYTISVVNTVTGIKFTPTVSDATATVKINGTAVASGTASAVIPLVLGPNTITTTVTAQDNTQKQYVVTVTRQRSSNADLSNLISNAGALSPGFSPTTPGYLVNVSNTTLTATVTPTVSDANATIKVAGQPLASGTESATIQLAPGNNPVAVEVTAQDGTIKTYTITIHRAFSNNANLGDLQLSAGTLSPAFASGTVDYTSTVPFEINRVKITPSLSDGTATVTVNGTTVTNGSSSGFVDLAVGQNTITVVVTAADGTSSQTYTVVVTREVQPPSADASLSSLALTQGELNPAFNRTTYSYAATVQSSVTKTNVIAISSEANAKITINGVPVASGASSGDILLSDGANQIFVVVTAEDGTNVKRYTIVVTRASFSAVLPNVFTPNGDGYNDTWVLANINLYPNCTVKIFNRGGQQVFNSVGYGIAWDGTFNGKLLAPDTYYYIIDLKHGQGVRSGSVTIIR
ncbi:cadherin-like beta sandwich domain-containing protein [Mucilaginibacter sp. ZT4R22]|uniref:Cadherin-like beta sandwich domain-containing protein n=1 Tax=Mucilaginibacter pankratovii TaxID=2772110 RepID=A0ABR7WSA8_9SPHI|nr:cadherin-like beta sandwich domain-containing protein [Mucilaginibacter pankratovii]MBD1365073.1 cadherin-like beta sandwich domain-containing protein [Mucilaginibacter pankratovii]